MSDTATDPRPVLITGGSGYLGGHLVRAALARGHAVRASLRDAGRGPALAPALAPDAAARARLSFVSLDLLADAGWDAAMDGVAGVIHAASPFVLDIPRDPEALIRPAVEGTTRALEAAARAGVGRVVLTSSTVAITNGRRRDARQAVYGAADWSVDGPALNPYAASKLRAERRARAIADRSGLALTVVNPGFITGPLWNADPGTSVALLLRLLRGALPAVPDLGFAIADVRDVAAVHLAALAAPETAGQRIPAAFHDAGMAGLARALKAAAGPERGRKVPTRALPDWASRMIALAMPDLRRQLPELGHHHRVDSSAAAALLGRAPITLEASLRDTVDSLVAQGLTA